MRCVQWISKANIRIKACQPSTPFDVAELRCVWAILINLVRIIRNCDANIPFDVYIPFTMQTALIELHMQIQPTPATKIDCVVWEI